MVLTAACQGCTREGKDLKQCQVRVYQFWVNEEKCPRELELAGMPKTLSPSKAQGPSAPTTIGAKPATAIAGWEPGAEETGPSPSSIGVPSLGVATRGVCITSDSILTIMLPLSAIELGVFTPRRVIDQGYVGELAEDLQREGQYKPIIVRPHPTRPNAYQLVDGEHRVRALQKIGGTLVRVEVRRLSDYEATALAMKVNMQHGLRLTELDEAYQIKRLRDEFKRTEEEIAKVFDRPQSWVSYRLSLVERAAEPVQQAIITRVITPVHARELVQLPKDRQNKALDVVKREAFSTRQTKKLVEAVRDKPEELDRLASLPKEDLISELEGKAPLHTDEEVEKFYDETEREEPTLVERCPGCGKALRIDWVAREITWE